MNYHSCELTECTPKFAIPAFRRVYLVETNWIYQVHDGMKIYTMLQQIDIRSAHTHTPPPLHCIFSSLIPFRIDVYSSAPTCLSNILCFIVVATIFCPLILILDSLFYLFPPPYRYYAIVRPLEYPLYMTNRTVFFMLANVWLLPALISFTPIFLGWYTTTESLKYQAEHLDDCIFVANKTYAIISSSVSFWIPGLVMITMYCRIYR